jgi:hypothetical protein
MFFKMKLKIKVVEQKCNSCEFFSQLHARTLLVLPKGTGNLCCYTVMTQVICHIRTNRCMQEMQVLIQIRNIFRIFVNYYQNNDWGKDNHLPHYYLLSCRKGNAHNTVGTFTIFVTYKRFFVLRGQAATFFHHRQQVESVQYHRRPGKRKRYLRTLLQYKISIHILE